MSNWKLAPSLLALLAQIDAAYPHRSKAWDRAIGGEAHAASVSDHNRNERGIVCAIDITHDPANGCNAAELSEALRFAADPRINYVIFNRRIFSAAPPKPWVWRPYNGASPHDHHVHISVLDDSEPWSAVP